MSETSETNVEVRHTVKQAAIVKYLARCTCPASPTEIGQACGKNYAAASSWASSGLAPLVKRGEVVRYDGGYYELAGRVQA